MHFTGATSSSEGNSRQLVPHYAPLKIDPRRTEQHVGMFLCVIVYITDTVSLGHGSSVSVVHTRVSGSTEFQSCEDALVTISRVIF